MNLGSLEVAMREVSIALISRYAISGSEAQVAAAVVTAMSAGPQNAPSFIGECAEAPPVLADTPQAHHVISHLLERAAADGYLLRRLHRLEGS